MSRVSPRFSLRPPPIKAACELLRAGQYEDAVALLAPAAAEHRRNPRVFLLLAQAELSLEHFSESRRAAERTIALRPYSYWAYCLLARALIYSGEKQSGLDAVITASEIVPRHYFVHETFAWAFLENGDQESALAAAEHAVELAPKMSRTHRTLGAIRLQREEWVGAEAAYRHALAIQPTDPGALNDLALAVEHQGRYREATELFEQAAKIAPTNDTIRRNLERQNRRSEPQSLWAQSTGIIADIEPGVDQTQGP
jgi:Flp pilus assembly protein TadD